MLNAHSHFAVPVNGNEKKSPWAMGREAAAAIQAVHLRVLLPPGILRRVVLER